MIQGLNCLEDLLTSQVYLVNWIIRLIIGVGFRVSGLRA